MCPDKVKYFQILVSQEIGLYSHIGRKEESLIRNTVAEPIDDIANKLRIKLCNISKHFKAFSVGVDESTDVNDVAQLLVFIRICNFEVCYY
jgi:hypothetical protein